MEKKNTPDCEPFKIKLSFSRNFLYPYYELKLFSVALQPKFGPVILVLGLLDHIQLGPPHTHPVGLFCTNDQPVAEAVAYVTQQTQETNIHALS